ncbi:stomatin-like protein [Perkinsela sp. CCAP 1560/4]|nr:stomatin-like protein [Perkinsela sp. CCAP 1560/4]|eukprot:KNH09225.1 stomatin-like protein [Perkinsela sp. CCAP 1560/4]
MHQENRASMGNVPQFQSFESATLPRSRSVVNTCINIVPEGEVWVVERLGKYLRTLTSGLWVLIPFVDKIQYVHSTKEQGIQIPHQSAITRDNVMVEIDGILFTIIVDAKKASYNIDNAIFNLINLAQTSMRSEIGKLSLDNLFEERDALNKKIVAILQKEASEWGVECKRYEIRDISVSDIVRKSMDLQAEAERRKRKLILESEGDREASINKAKGYRIAMEQEAMAKKFMKETVSRGDLTSALNKLEGVKATMQEVRKLLISDKKPESMKDISEATKDAMQFMLASEYLEQFGKVAKENNSVVLAAPLSDPQSMITQALTLTKGLKR